MSEHAPDGSGGLLSSPLHSAQVGQLAAALAAAQGEFQPILKDRTVTVRGTRRDGSETSYTFAYATLDAILTAVRPSLAEHGLALVQLVDGDAVRTMVLHTSGEWLAHELPLIPQAEPQRYGSELSYKRRYGISTLLCVAADEDDDGNSSAGNEAQSAPRRRREKPPAAPAPETGKAAQPDMLEVERQKIRGYLASRQMSEDERTKARAWLEKPHKLDALCAFSARLSTLPETSGSGQSDVTPEQANAVPEDDPDTRQEEQDGTPEDPEDPGLPTEGQLRAELIPQVTAAEDLLTWQGATHKQATRKEQAGTADLKTATVDGLLAYLSWLQEQPKTANDKQRKA